MTTVPRVAPGDRHSVGLLVTGFARIAGRVTGTAPPSVFLTLGHQRRLFWSWLVFAGALMPGGRLPRRRTELVILRVATLAGSDYELTQHRRLGRRAGLTREEIEQIEVGPTAPGGDAWDGWDQEDRLLLDVTDELMAHEDLGDQTWGRLRAAYDEAACVEVIMLVGHYRMLATALTTLRVQPDRAR